MPLTEEQEREWARLQARVDQIGQQRFADAVNEAQAALRWERGVGNWVQFRGEEEAHWVEFRTPDPTVLSPEEAAHCVSHGCWLVHTAEASAPGGQTHILETRGGDYPDLTYKTKCGEAGWLPSYGAYEWMVQMDVVGCLRCIELLRQEMHFHVTRV